MDKVSIVKCESYGKEKVFLAVKQALSLIGFRMPKSGAKILLKPNLLGAFPLENAVTTHPAVVEACCRIFKGYKLYVGDSCGAGERKGTENAFKESGIAAVAKKYNATFINIDAEKKITIENKKNKVLKKLVTAAPVLNMDFIVNLPKIKTHMLTGYTGAMKNMFGIMPGRSKTGAHAIGRKIEQFNQIVVDIYNAVTPNLNIMDGIVGMDGNGPSNGNPKHTGIIAASVNGAAMDAVITQAIGFKKGDVGTVEVARKRKLFDNIQVFGLKDFRCNYKKPHTYKSKLTGIVFSRINRLISPRFVADKKKCIKCGYCIRACPMNCIKFVNGYPKFDSKNCISCYCCEEVCPEHAVSRQLPLFAKLFDMLRGRD